LIPREDDQRNRLQQHDLQRLGRDRHPPRQGRGDLVPRVDRLHDIEHRLRRSPGGQRQRSHRPLRRHLARGRRG